MSIYAGTHDVQSIEVGHLLGAVSVVITALFIRRHPNLGAVQGALFSALITSTL